MITMENKEQLPVKTQPLFSVSNTRTLDWNRRTCRLLYPRTTTPALFHNALETRVISLHDASKIDTSPTDTGPLLS